MVLKKKVKVGKCIFQKCKVRVKQTTLPRKYWSFYSMDGVNEKPVKAFLCKKHLKLMLDGIGKVIEEHNRGYV